MRVHTEPRVSGRSLQCLPPEDHVYPSRWAIPLTANMESKSGSGSQARSGQPACPLRQSDCRSGAPLQSSEVTPHDSGLFDQLHPVQGNPQQRRIPTRLEKKCQINASTSLCQPSLFLRNRPPLVVPPLRYAGGGKVQTPDNKTIGRRISCFSKQSVSYVGTDLAGLNATDPPPWTTVLEDGADEHHRCGHHLAFLWRPR